MRMNIDEIITAVSAISSVKTVGQLPGPDIFLTRATMDSRAASGGSLFIAIPGARVDGHDFAAQAIANGALVILAEKEIKGLPENTPVIIVENSVTALGQIAAAWRRKCKAKVAAITGTAGKTTVKEFLAAILGRKNSVSKNKGNWNNQIGLPLSILEAKESDDFWIFELGISQPGDMEELGQIVEPDLAVIVNVGSGHLEGLGGISGVAQAKSKLLRYLRPGGLALVSCDYPELWAEASQLSRDLAGFSIKGKDSALYSCQYLGSFAPPHVAADEINILGGANGNKSTPDRRCRFALEMDGLRMILAAPWGGEHLAEDIICACSAALVLGAKPQDICTGLVGVELPASRFRMEQAGEIIIIDDTYNANPLSMRRALSEAVDIAAGIPLVLVLGDMLELGKEAASAHQELGLFIASLPCAAVFFQGEHNGDVSSGLKHGGFGGKFVKIDAGFDLLAYWKNTFQENLDRAVVLFKGSRSTNMEKGLAAFQEALSARSVY